MKMAPLDAFDAFNTCFPELYKTAVNGIDFFPIAGSCGFSVQAALQLRQCGG